MTEQRPHMGEAEDAPPRQKDPKLETLREILFSHYRQRIAELEAELDALERRVTDEDALIATIAPVMGEAIRRKIRDAREEMIEAFYPIIGQVVVRAVSEAIRDLVRTIDAQSRIALNPGTLLRRLRARLGGVSGGEMVLRESLPFHVAQVFLIHRETGLLLWHLSQDPAAAHDSDLISGMLTAIRDFVQDAFGQGEEGDLDEIQYGERRILIETAQRAYLAVVVEGIEPPGFRAEMRERIIQVDHTYEETLRHYDGDPASLAPAGESLRALLKSARQPELSSAQKRLLAGSFITVFFCLLGMCLAAGWVWRAVRTTPTPTAVVLAPTSTPEPTLTPTLLPTPGATALPTATSRPTATASSTPRPSPTVTATSSPTPIPTPTPAPVLGVMTGNVWLRLEPSTDASRLGVILERGEPVEILAVWDNWCWVRWAPEVQSEVRGWVPVEWVGVTGAIPARIVTPTAGP